MSRLSAVIAALFCSWLLLLSGTPAAGPSSAAESAESAEESLPEAQIQVTVSIFENVGHSYLVGPLALSCPESASPDSLLQLLWEYAYLESVTYNEGELVALETENGRYAADENGDGWVFMLNGQEIDPAKWAEDGRALTAGDSLSWLYSLEGGGPDDTSETGYSRPPAPAGGGFWDGDYNNLLTRACSWLKQSSSSASTLFALGTAGYSVDHKYLTGVLRQVSEDGVPNHALLADSILAVSFSGISAENVSGQDLISALASCPDLTRTETVWALIAADCNAYPLPEGAANNRQALLNVILAAQNEDGGIAPERGAESSLPATAAAVTALAAYCEDDAVQLAVDRGVAYLAGRIDPETGYCLGNDGRASCEAAAMTVMALGSLNIPLDDVRFMVGPQNLLEQVLAFQQENGGFAEHINGDADVRATWAAVLAMAAQKNGGNPCLLRSPVMGNGSPVIASSVPVEEESLPLEEEPEVEEAFGTSFLFGAAGLAIGLLLGTGALWFAVRMMKQADKDEQG